MEFLRSFELLIQMFLSNIVSLIIVISTKVVPQMQQGYGIVDLMSFLFLENEKVYEKVLLYTHPLPCHYGKFCNLNIKIKNLYLFLLN